MTSVIKIKRSEVAGNPAVLGAGELAYSALPDNGSNGGDRLYIGTGIETNGNAVNHVVIGGKYFTDQINSASSNNTANVLVKRDNSGNFSANLITANLSGNSTTASSWQTARDFLLTGDASATFTGVNGSSNASATITLATVNSNVGTFGGGSAVPVITVNEKGLVTSVTTSPISGSLNIAGNTGTDTVNLGTDTLTFTGSSGVTTSVANNQVSFSIGQDVATTSNVTFNNVSASGNLTVAGDLTVNGTTTTVNSTAVAISDVNLTLAKDATTAAQANGAGLTVTGPTTPATLTYTSADDSWNFNKRLKVSTITGNLSGTALEAGRLQYPITVTAIGDAFLDVQFSGNEGIVQGNIVLQTVNGSPGTFGNATAVPSVTVNAKGLVTSVTTNEIPTATTTQAGLAKFDANTFEVLTGLVTLSVVDGGTY